MATINLGNIKFNWKGTYAGGTAYVIDDVVSYSGSSYICKLASTGNLPTNTTYWDVMSQAGTNGTDVGTTITTQGDILYRDASGLARLGAGTSGQYLETKGTGQNPVWSTISSDYVKVAEGSVTNTQSWDFASTIFDNSIYMNYDFYLEAKKHSGTGSGNGELRFIDNNGSNIGAGTTSGNILEMNSSSGNVNGYNRDGTDSTIFLQDGVRDSYGIYWGTIQGLGRAVHKSGYGITIRPNHDGSTRTRSSWWTIWGSNNQATNWGIRWQFPQSMTGTYKIFGRK